MVLLRSGYPECDETFSLAVRMRDSYMRELAECGFAVPGARETLAELGKAYGIYVITNGIDWIQKRRIERSGLGDLFKGVFVSEAAGYSKPDPGFFEYAVSHVGDPDRSAYAVIGDSLTSDCDGAMGAGMDFIWHNPKGNEADRNGHFGRRIIVAEYRDISALPGIIESL